MANKLFEGKAVSSLQTAVGSVARFIYALIINRLLV